jgi:Polysaccharide pyruvyl transferase
MTTLIAGWFSFEGMGTTAGDLLASDVVQAWLTEASEPFDVACAPTFRRGVRWEEVQPQRYDHVIFVCGPIGNGPPVREFLDRFAGCDLIGIDLTMLDPLEQWNPFDLLMERDSDKTSRPDLSFAAPDRRVPVVGVVLLHDQPEYGDRDLHELANAKIEFLIGERECARVEIDTRLEGEANVLQTPAEITSLIAAVDVVVTTRLHGIVLALRSGVPVLAIDPVEGGAKVTRQAARLGWPHCYPADAAMDTLRAGLDRCLERDAVEAACSISRRARTDLEEVRAAVVARLARYRRSRPV